MIVRIDPGSPSSPAEQLVAQIAASIEAGELSPGDRLPTIRALAADLGLAAGTVAKSYTELERAGWLHGQGRRGTVVAERRPSAEELQVAAAAAALADVVSTSRLGTAEAHRALDLALARLQRGGAAT